jgi:cytochrome c2
MWGGARGDIPCHHIETLAATSHGPDIETLVGREVLAHWHTMFHPCTCDSVEVML